MHSHSIVVHPSGDNIVTGRADNIRSILIPAFTGDKADPAISWVSNSEVGDVLR